MNTKILIIVLIALIAVCVFAGAYLAAFGQARDNERIIDLTQIAKALALYDQTNGYYPNGTNTSNEPTGMTSYLGRWPVAPQADGNCTSAENTYTYTQISNGDNYQIIFCLGSSAHGLSAGLHTMTANGFK